MLPTPTLPAIAHDRPVCVAFSGGLDSTALLHALANARAIRANGLRALHVHHGLQAQANAWAEHCREVCRALHVPLDVLSVQVIERGDGLEAAARRARYEAIAAALKPDEVLVTAHHRDDQAETFLLRALRGSGVDGLAAMRDWRRFARGWHWRPWLAQPRARLLAYAQAHGLRWIEDPSNADSDLDRNFLRNEIMPLLRRRWPHAAASFARSAALATATADLLTSEDAMALAMAATLDAHTLSVAALLPLLAERRARVLRHWIGTLKLPPLPAEGVARMESYLLRARADAQPRFAWNGVAVQRWRDLLHAGRERPALPAQWREPWDGRLPLLLPGGGELRLEGANALPVPMFAHARHGGERIHLPSREHSHALKHVLQDLGVPPWVRVRLPLLSTAAGSLQAAGDLVYAHDLDQWLRRHGARLLWRDGTAD